MGYMLLWALLAQDISPPVQVASGAIQPHMAIDAEGTIYIVFIRGRNIEISISTDRGKTFSAPVLAINANNRAGGGMQRGPRVAVDGKKTVYVTAPLCFDEEEFKKKYPTQDLYLSVSADGGKTFGKPAMVNGVAKTAPESLHWLAAAPTGDVFVAWLDRSLRSGPGQDLGVAKLTDQGKKVGKAQVIANALCECCAPGLAVDPKGNPIVVYREGGSKTNRQIYIAMSSNGGGTFAKSGRLNQGETKVDG